jgi:hypothetical protein
MRQGEGVEKKYRMLNGFRGGKKPAARRRPGRSQSAMRSADVSDAFLVARLFHSRRFGGQLQNGSCLTFTQQSQQHDAPIGKFERVVMGGRFVPIDLSKDGRPVADGLGFPAE